MTGDVSTGNHNVSLTLTIRLTSSSRFDIGSCGSITPSSTIRNVKDLISQREESGHCAAERQRLIYKGRILSEEGRTLADYGIGNDGGASSGGGDGIVLYLVKSGGGVSSNAGAAAATNTASTSAPPAATQQPNPNSNAASNPFLNFNMPNTNNNNNNQQQHLIDELRTNLKHNNRLNDDMGPHDMDLLPHPIILSPPPHHALATED
mmetsp:Transcript_8669/g.14145  ORF Transcript_8669/g.14145 Transcript_8669/m.14145 type:complete len:207 (-) Transcript_8669:618-1238(-)